MTVDEAVGTLVHRVMWQAKVTQRSLAPRLGLTQSALSKKISGKNPWSVEDLLTVAHELGVEPRALVPEIADETEPADEAPATGLEPVTCRALTVIHAA
jgi:transcriptional regulator with XRE-family HTH domain